MNPTPERPPTAPGTGTADTPPRSPAAPWRGRLAHAEFKAALLLVFLALLLAGSGLYLLYARGAFEPTQRLVLLADDSEGITVGMNVTFSGFPIGRVRRIELGPNGNVRILVDVPQRDAGWLRTSSVFTLERNLLGSTRIRAYSGLLDDPALPDGAERAVLKGDAMAELPGLLNEVKSLLANLNAMTGSTSLLNAGLENVRAVTERLKGPQGALGVLTGNEDDARQIMQTVRQTQALLVRLEAVAARTEGLVGRADAQVFGADGLVSDTQATVRQLNAALADARRSLQRVDAVLAEAEGVARNTREATVDLSALRAEVDASLQKVQHLVNEVNRRWPLARDVEVKLP